MAKRLTSLLPRLILHIDFALEWVQVNSGQILYHQKEDSDAINMGLHTHTGTNGESPYLGCAGFYGRVYTEGSNAGDGLGRAPAVRHP